MIDSEQVEQSSDVSALSPAQADGAEVDAIGDEELAASEVETDVADLVEKNAHSAAAEHHGKDKDQELLKAATASPPEDDKIYQFTHHLAHYTHKSWYKKWDQGELMLRMIPHERSKPYVSREILRIMELSSETPSELSTSNVLLLALSSSEKLQSIVWRLGLLTRGSEFKNIVDGGKIRNIVAVVGMESYKFAIKNAGRIKTIGGKEYKAPDHLLDISSSDFEKNMLLSGMYLMASLCKELDSEVYKRILLKLPFGWASQYSPDEYVELDKSIFPLIAELQELDSLSSLESLCDMFNS